MVSPKRRRAVVGHLQVEGRVSQRRGCALVGVSRSSLYYEPRRRADEEALRARIRQLSRRHKRYGCRRIQALLHREGWVVNHKRVHRIWKQESLTLPRKRPRSGVCGPRGEVQ